MKSPTIACVGAGQMATALVCGWVSTKLCVAQDVVACDPDPAARRRFADHVPGARVEPTSRDVIGSAGIVLLATKPHQLAQVAQEIRPLLTEQQLLISVAAGVTLARLSEWFGTRADHTRDAQYALPRRPRSVRLCARGAGHGPGCGDRAANDECGGRGVSVGGIVSGRRDRVIRIGSRVRVFADRGVERWWRAGGSATRRSLPPWRLRRCGVRPKWCWFRASIRRCSRTAWPVPAARPSRGCTLWRSTVCGRRRLRRSWRRRNGRRTGSRASIIGDRQ